MKLISLTVINTETNTEIPSRIFLELTDSDFSKLEKKFSNYQGPVMDFFNEAVISCIGIWNLDILMIDEESACIGPVLEHTTHTFYDFGN